MRSILLSAALAAAALLGGYGTASAQVGFGIYLGPDHYDDGPTYYRYSEPAPRVYSYRRYDSEPIDEGADVVVRRGSGGCGTYYFWDGERCVDARQKRD
jgi:hypothetical protein